MAGYNTCRRVDRRVAGQPYESENHNWGRAKLVRQKWSGRATKRVESEMVRQ